MRKRGIAPLIVGIIVIIALLFIGLIGFLIFKGINKNNSNNFIEERSGNLENSNQVSESKSLSGSDSETDCGISSAYSSLSDTLDQSKELYDQELSKDLALNCMGENFKKSCSPAKVVLKDNYNLIIKKESSNCHVQIKDDSIGLDIDCQIDYNKFLSNQAAGEDKKMSEISNAKMIVLLNTFVYGSVSSYLDQSTKDTINSFFGLSNCKGKDIGAISNEMLSK